MDVEHIEYGKDLRECCAVVTAFEPGDELLVDVRTTGELGVRPPLRSCVLRARRAPQPQAWSCAGSSRCSFVELFPPGRVQELTVIPKVLYASPRWTRPGQSAMRALRRVVRCR